MRCGGRTLIYLTLNWSGRFEKLSSLLNARLQFSKKRILEHQWGSQPNYDFDGGV